MTRQEWVDAFAEEFHTQNPKKSYSFAVRVADSFYEEFGIWPYGVAPAKAVMIALEQMDWRGEL